MMNRLLPRPGARLVAPLLLAVAACGGGTEPATVAAVAVDPPARTLYVGPGGNGSAQLTATPQAAGGRALQGRAVTWSTSAPAVAVVSPTGLVSAVGTGTASISAASGSAFGTAAITVALVPVASVAVAPRDTALFAGTAIQLSAEPRDSTGRSLLGRPVTWASRDTARAGVNAFGLVTARAAGAVRIVATSEARSDSITLTVLAPAGPVLAGVSPATLVPGAVATLSGTGFGSLAGSTLRLRGTVVPLLSVSATEATFRVPCVGSGPAALQVTDAVTGPGTILEAPVAVTQRALAVGQALVLPTADQSACNELPATGGAARYLLAAFSVATSANTLIDLELGGNTGTGAGVLAESRLLEPAAVPPRRGREAAMDEAHFRHLERERALYERLRAAGAFRTAPPARQAALLAEPPAVGAIRTVYYNFGSCSDSSRVIRARAVRVGTHAVVWEDSANALLSENVPELATAYARIGEVFDRDQYEAVRTYFGDPLRRDPFTDGDGLLHMVFTQRLNGSGAAAYVTSCDMVPRNLTTTAASNNGEFFYGVVPTTAAPNVNSTASPDGWYAFMSRTVVHEVKHIASLSARIANNAPFESSWLEEGTARHAEEVWVRDSLHRVPWRGNTGYGTAATNGVRCDFNLADATCIANDPLRRPTWGMRRQFNEILPKLLDPADWSPFGDGTGQSGAVFYNTTWSLVRWASDRYGTTDAAFLTALTQSSATGLGNLAGATGASVEQLLGYWGLALLADDLPGVPSLSDDVQFRTWDLRSIYAGLNADPAWSSRFTTPYPVTRQVTGLGAFSFARNGVRGGAHLFFELAGSHTVPQLLHLRAPGGGAIPPNARLAILRVQ